MKKKIIKKKTESNILFVAPRTKVLFFRTVQLFKGGLGNRDRPIVLPLETGIAEDNISTCVFIALSAS